MKVLSLIFICALNLSLINTSNSFIHRKEQKIPNIALRNLDEASNLKLMLVGFGNYSDKTFNIYFKEYNTSNLYNDENLHLNVTISYQNGAKIEISCDKVGYKTESQEKDTRIYTCGDVDPKNTQEVKLLKYSFYNNSNKAINIEIVESSLANSTKGDISACKASLNFTTFYFDDVSIYESTAEIMGNLEKYEQDKDYFINIGGNSYKCEVNNTKIIFDLEKSAKENLIGKMLFNSSNSSNAEPKILIFSNKTNEYYLYYFNLYGFLGFNKYQEPSNTKDATNLANFRGTKGTFKEYLKFNISISTETTNLRNLQEINSTAYGKWDDSNNYNNGLITYNVTLGNTMGKNIVDIKRITDFEFSNDNKTFVPYNQLKNLTKNSENLMEKNEIQYVLFSNISEYETNNKTNFSFNIITENEISLIYGESQANLSYIQNENNKKEETIICNISKTYIISKEYKIYCEPKHDINASFSLLKIIIDNEIDTRRRLRFLESSRYITQLYPGEDVSGNIEFEYNPDIKTFKSDSGKGLSGGAIAGIVLGSVAAVVAIGIAIYCLTRKSPPTMPANNANFQDSSININK